MKFKDLREKTIFTWWEHDALLLGVKTGTGQAFCWNDYETHALHANKDVKEPEPITEDLILKFGRTGQAFLCSPIPGGKWLARCILLTTGGIMRDDQFKPPVSTPKTGETPENAEQVYIMWKLLTKKLQELDTLAQGVEMLLEDGLSVGLSDNKIMSTVNGPMFFLHREQ